MFSHWRLSRKGGGQSSCKKHIWNIWIWNFTKLRCPYLLRQDWLRVNICEHIWQKAAEILIPKANIATSVSGSSGKAHDKSQIASNRIKSHQIASNRIKSHQIASNGIKSHQITHILPQTQSKTYVMRDFLTTLWNFESSCGLRHSSRSPLTRIRNYWANQPCISLCSVRKSAMYDFGVKLWICCAPS